MAIDSMRSQSDST